MKFDYIKFRQKNKTEGDCQLISAVNAYYFLTGKYVSDDRYEKFIDLCRCKHGSAISIEKVWKKLGIGIIKEFKKHDLPKKIKPILPLEVRVWHPHYGFHSVLIIDHEPITDSHLVTNFRYATNSVGWIFREDFDVYLSPQKEWCDCTKKWPFGRDKSAFRQLGLIKMKDDTNLKQL